LRSHFVWKNHNIFSYEVKSQVWLFLTQRPSCCQTKWHLLSDKFSIEMSLHLTEPQHFILWSEISIMTLSGTMPLLSDKVTNFVWQCHTCNFPLSDAFTTILSDKLHTFIRQSNTIPPSQQLEIYQCKTCN
jgi:hypothetical protein